MRRIFSTIGETPPRQIEFTISCLTVDEKGIWQARLNFQRNFMLPRSINILAFSWTDFQSQVRKMIRLHIADNERTHNIKLREIRKGAEPLRKPIL